MVTYKKARYTYVRTMCIYIYIYTYRNPFDN